MNRRKVVTAMAILGVAAGISSTSKANDADNDTIETSLGQLTVHPVQHASLVLTFGDEAIYVDPVGGVEAYAHLPAPTAILITHGHSDHFDPITLSALAGASPLITNKQAFPLLPDALKENTTVFANGDSGEILGLPIRAIGAYNTTEERLRYHPQGVGNGYVLTIGGKQIYIAGDTEPTPDMLALTDIELAFLPMNLPYTMTQEQAAEAINGFKPRIVYPYHYSQAKLDVVAAAVGPDTQLRIRDWY